MNFFGPFRSGGAIPAGIPEQAAAAGLIASCIVFEIVAMVAILLWLWNGDPRLVDFWFRQVGGPLLVGYAVIEWAAAARVLQWFQPGEPMRRPWLLLTAAGATHMTSLLFRHWLGQPLASNPLLLWPEGRDWIPLCAEFGRRLGGTLYLALLAAGLGFALRVHGRLKLLSPPGRKGWAVLVTAAALYAYTLISLVYWLQHPRPNRNALWWMGWLTDPLLAALLVLALLLVRSTEPLSGGLLARPWRAYQMALLLTCAGSFFAGLADSGVVSSSWLWPGWLAWHPASALFALAPVWQLEACRVSVRAFGEAQAR